MKITGATIGLLEQREHLDVVERMIRGGISSVFGERHFVANNKFTTNFDESKPESFALFIDANGLYSGIMEHFCLPVSDF